MNTIKDDPESTELLVKKDTISAWAAKNAYTLVFLSIMFFITWIVITIVGIIYGGPS